MGFKLATSAFMSPNLVATEIAVFASTGAETFTLAMLGVLAWLTF
jgi:hypothetical protein